MKNAQILIEALAKIAHKKYYERNEDHSNRCVIVSLQAMDDYNASDVPETGMRWVKASERLPKKRRRYNYHVKLLMAKPPHILHDYLFNSTCLFDGEKFVDDINVRRLSHGYTVEEWLDESPNSEQEVL